ncbi:MAG TPA: hypothetical protein VHB74_03235 [Devosia sp.]|nr:hypothetical protein [Devosia sp.]
MSRLRLVLLTLAAAALPAAAAAQQGPAAAPEAPAAGGRAPAMSNFGAVEPPFTIWDVKLGAPVSQIPDADIVNVSCGSNGGPPSLPLKNFSEFAKCPPERSGLHEVHFEYDDEQTYIAKALELEYRYLAAGTSVYAHPVDLSVLVDDKGIARGIRIITDDTASLHDRRGAYQLADSLKSRYQSWHPDCQELPPADGEQPVGGIFVHEICTGTDAATGDQFRMEARYMRRKGEVAIDPQTQQIQRNNFDSTTRFELVQPPYKPSTNYALVAPPPVPAASDSEPQQ